MPRLVRAVPRYRKHKASGRAIVTIGGVTHYLGPHGSQTSIDAYDRLIAEYLSAKRTAAVVNDHSVSVAEILLAFLHHADVYYVKDGKHTSEYTAFRRMARTLKRLYGTTPAVEFGPLALKAVRETWVQQGLARKSVNQQTGRVVRMFKWAVAEELIPSDVWQSLRSVAGLKRGRSTAPERPRVLPVSIEEIQHTIPHMSPIVADMVRLQMLTGMRPGEVCRLTPAQIDRSNDIWEYRPETHKTSHHGLERVIYFGPQSQQVIAKYLFRAKDVACFSPIESMRWFRDQREAARKTPPSCGNSRKRTKRKPFPKRVPRDHYDNSSYAQAIAYACQKAWPIPESIQKDRDAAKDWEKLHRWAPNRIRHTRATEIRTQFGLEAAQIILGHQTADITQIYAERDAEKAKTIAKEIG